MSIETVEQFKLAVEVQIVIKAIEKCEKVTPHKAKEILLENPIPLGKLGSFVDFDHPALDCYGRKMIYIGENFELMLMSWNPGNFSAIHDHGYTQWGAVYLYRNVQHNIYSIKNKSISFGKKKLLPAGSAVAVNHALVHQMGNPSTERLCSLHLYGCETEMDEITADTRIFELENKVVKHTTGGAFFNLPVEVVYDYEPCPTPNRETMIYHCGLLLDYFNRQNMALCRTKVENVLRWLEEMDSAG